MSAIDLSRLPSPHVVEPLDVEAIFSDMLDSLGERDQSLVRGLSDSDPAWKLLQICAYREMIVRQRVNDAARAVMLAYAQGNDLDQLAALFGVERLVIDPGNESAVPPVPATYESDENLRYRTQISLDGLSVAGPEGAYRFHALSVSGEVLDASATSPSPGEVLVTVLARAGNGKASKELLGQVNQSVNAENVRPLTDHVTVQSASIKEYRVKATLYLYAGPDAGVVIAAAKAGAEQYAKDRHLIGQDVTLSGLYGALQQPGVQRVELKEPKANIVIDRTEASYCTGINIEFGGVDE
ncbi:baseplate assembly protein [Carnimonas bestiolae]|uniref:baseplate assembly protein n=1 Tax=Carnimonas bestiolae TaxID=3402172 RepID=UPI003EDC30DF